jgi:hypothetical protein
MAGAQRFSNELGRGIANHTNTAMALSQTLSRTFMTRL